MKKLVILTLLVILSSNISFSEELKWDNGKIRENKIFYDEGNQFIAEIEYYREDGTLEKTIKYNMDEQITEIAYTKAELSPAELIDDGEAIAEARWKSVEARASKLTGADYQPSAAAGQGLDYGY